jgi:hypothetical protein
MLNDTEILPGLLPVQQEDDYNQQHHGRRVHIHRNGGSGAGQHYNGQDRRQKKPHHVSALQRMPGMVIDVDQSARRAAGKRPLAGRRPAGQP